MNEIWLNKEQVQLFEGIKRRAFFKWLKVGKLTATRYIDAPSGGGKNGKVLQIALSCLSAAAQDKYYLGFRVQGSGLRDQEEQKELPGGQTAPVNIQNPPPLVNPCAGDLPGVEAPSLAPALEEIAPAADLEQGAGVGVQGSGEEKQIEKRRTEIPKYLTIKQEKTAALRYDLVSLYREAKSQARASKISVGAGAKEWLKLYNTGLPYPTLFAEIGEIAKPTLDAWNAKLRAANNNMNVLAPMYGQHVKGKRKVTGEEFQYCLRYALRPAQHPLEEAIRLAKSHMAKDGLASPTSAATLRRALEDWRSKHYDKWVFCREGEKALNDKVLPYIERDMQQLAVGDVLVVDGHTLNFQTVNPYTGKSGRATLLMFFDWASRYPAGWYIMMTENIQCVHAALRRAIINLGKIPTMCYLDNGRAFRSKYFNGVKDFKECGFEGLYGRLGIRATYAKPYNAQSKSVERFFGSFGELERLMPSYSGTSIESKPAHMMRNERLHKRLHSDYVPTIQQADLLVQTWVEQEYGPRPHRGLDMRCPLDIWNEGKGPGIDDGLLWALLLSQEIKNVGRNGITFLGVHFYDDALYGLKDRVMIRYDILDLSKILIFTPDGSDFICAARPVEKIHPMASMSNSPLDLQAVTDANKAKARLKKSTEKDFRQLALGINFNFPGRELEEPHQLTRPEADEIEAAAARCQVIDMTPALPEGRPLFADEIERYEWCCRQQATGQAVTHEDICFMAEFEQGDQYLQLEGYFKRVQGSGLGGQG